MPPDRSSTSIPMSEDTSSTPTRRTISVPRSADDDVISCQRCRHRKKRCDRGKPSCEGCLKSKSDCVYASATPDKASVHIVSKLSAEIDTLRQRCQELEGQITILTQPIVSPTIDLNTIHRTQTQSSTGNTPILHALSSPVRSTYLGQSPSSSALCERVLLRLLTKEQDAASSFRGSIGQQLGVSPDVNESTAGKDQNSPLWPQRPVAQLLVDHYFKYMHAMLPLMDKATIDNDLQSIYGDSLDPPDLMNFTVPDVRVYRLCLIFTAPRGMLGKEQTFGFDMDFTRLHAVAMRHMGGALRGDELLINQTAVSCVGLLVLISIVDFVTMNPYQVVSLAADMAIEAGLHQDDLTVTAEVLDYRRRLFWAIFCMDRTISSLLMKPVSIPEDIITTRLPRVVPGALIQSDHMSSTLFFCQLVLFRRLQGIMLEKVYLAQEITDSEAIFSELRNLIDEWWVNTAGPPVPNNILVGHGPEPFFELNYNCFLTNLYRPSKLFLQTHPMRMPVLRSVACRGLVLYQQFDAARRIPQNYVHLYYIVILSVSLLYVLGESEGDVRNLGITSWRTKALEDIDFSESFLATFCTGWPGVNRFREAFSVLANNVRNRLNRQPDQRTIAPWPIPMAEVQSQAEPIEQLPTNADAWATWVAGLADLPAVTSRDPLTVADGDAFLSSVGLSEWLNGLNGT